MWNYLWPILLVIAANTFYNICAKSIPGQSDPFATLIVTYLSAAAGSAALFFLSGGPKNLLTEFRTLNWTSLAFGCSIVALEFGYIQIYRAGWDISVGPLVANVGLACSLALVGTLLYQEALGIRQLAGIALCLAGIWLIQR